MHLTVTYLYITKKTSMKSQNLLAALIILAFVPFTGFSQIKMNNVGRVIIGSGSPTSEKLFLNGNLRVRTTSPHISDEDLLITTYGFEEEPAIYCTDNYYGYLGISTRRFNEIHAYQIRMNGSLVLTSDGRFKENVRGLSGALNKVNNLNPVMYDFTAESFGEVKETKRQKLVDENKNRMGFIAQELQKEFPELVVEDENGNLGVDYIGLIPALVGALQEQQLMIQSLNAEVKSLKNPFSDEMQLKSGNLSSFDETPDKESENSLFQNAPNPFTGTTRIEYYLVEGAQNAQICVYTMSGMQLKCYPLESTSYGNITINGSELGAGMYMYALIADGKAVDTKQMVLTD